jgi:penicillin-insensitive murein endopeptidase
MLLILLAILALPFGNDALRLLESDAPSKSVGSTSDGTLINGKRLPSRGENYRTYSDFGSLIGRTCVHGKVRAAMLQAYAAMTANFPDAEFTFGETAWCWGGGPLRPHRTHQNGLSVDFMVPVLDKSGAPTSYPAWPWTQFGYAVEFDAAGHGDQLRIDFNAIAAHLLALDRAARQAGIRIRRVIFAPELRKLLFDAEDGETVRNRIKFMPGKAWVRHDEHYHVDLEL